MIRLLLLATLLVVPLVSVEAFAHGLLINATEYGVGKFHRYDNKQHPYAPNNVWTAHIMPDNAGASSPVVFKNADHSITIQFSTLDELLRTMIQISHQENQKVEVLNINGHGMPGGMWYPKNAAQENSSECASWVSASKEPDKENYNEYYSPVSKMEIMEIRAASNFPAHYACVTGVPEWQEVVSNLGTDIKQFFNDDAQIHFESCVVGLGPVGDHFTMAIAQLLLPSGHGMVKTSMNFGLGDWSMPEGMGFWDYQSDDQLNHDNDVYPKNRRDREIMQKGTIRVATMNNGKWTSSLVADQDFMMVGFQSPGFSNSNGRVLRDYHTPYEESTLPATVRIPGTAVHVNRLR